MGLRINPDTTQNLLATLQKTTQIQNDILERFASGQRVNDLGKDPVAVAQLVLNRGDFKMADQFIRNISNIRSRLEAADGALNSGIIVMTRAIALGTQGANGPLSQANRDAIALEIDTLRDQLLALANTSFRGVYLFAGTAVDVQPFVLDGAEPSGVRYDGNINVNDIEITEGQMLQVQVPGSQIFADPAADLFGALTDLSVALRTDTNVAAAADQIGVAFQHLNAERAFYGTTLASLNNSEAFLDREKIQLKQRENDLVADDFAASISEFSSVETARNAILAVGARISQLSLFDFLR